MTVITDQGCDITIKKYVGFEVLASIAGSNQLTLPLDDLSGVFLAVTATNAAGDTSTEYLNVLVVDAPPPLVVDVNEDGVVSAANNGSFTITGQTSPNAWVVSSSGFSAQSGNDGRFSLSGLISGGSETLYLMVGDAAGNSESAAVTLVRGSSNNTSGGGSSGGSGGATTPAVTTPEPEGDNGKITDLGDGYTLVTPEGYDPDQDGDGVLSLPGGGTVYTPDATKIIVTSGTVVGKDLRISFPQGSGGGAITDRYGNSFNVPEDAVIILDLNTPLGYYISIDNQFTDVKDSDWFYNAVMFAYSHGLMVGTSTNPMMFSPGATTTRGMIVTVLYHMAGNPMINAEFRIQNAEFGDVDEGMWYSDAVLWAASIGLVQGYGDRKFGPNDPVSRQDLAVILARYADFMGIALLSAQSYPGFNDEADIANYAKEAIERLFKANIVSGYPDGSFNPQGKAVRAEVAAMLMRFIEAME